MTSAARPRPKLSHIGIYVRDMDRMLDFYRKVFGFVVSDQGHGTAMPIQLVFLTADPTMHHQLVLASGRPDEATFSTVNQLSFTVQDLDELRDIRRRLVDNGATDLLNINHGNAWSVYADDPENNRIEVYLDSPFYVPQPHFDELDLTMSDEDILTQTEEVCRRDAGFMLREDWQKSIAQQLENDT